MKTPVFCGRRTYGTSILRTLTARLMSHTIHIVWVAGVLLSLLCACGKSGPADGERKPTGGVDFGGGGGGGQSTQKVSLRVASFNILKPEGRRSEMSLDNKAVGTALGRCIEAAQAQIVAFNELDANCIPGGKYALPSYCNSLPASWIWRLRWPNDIKSDGTVGYSYANGYAYDSDVLREEERGYVWLAKENLRYFSEPNDAYLKVGSPERTCIFVRFTYIKTGAQFWFFITHLPTSGQGGGEMMAANVNRLASQKGGGFPQILCGDMNSAPGSNVAPYNKLKTYWRDAYETVSTYSQIGEFATYSGTLSGSSGNYEKHYSIQTFTRDHPERRIDHIMTHGVCAATTYETVWTTYKVNGEAWCPSDHLPVVANIEF